MLPCNFTNALWCEVCSMFGVHWVMPRTVSSLLFWWRNWFHKHSSIVWNLVPNFLVWLVWKEHNSHTFQNVKSSLEQLVQALYLHAEAPPGEASNLEVLVRICYLNFPANRVRIHTFGTHNFSRQPKRCSKGKIRSQKTIKAKLLESIRRLCKAMRE